jgi:protein O-GlcNAc transferase
VVTVGQKEEYLFHREKVGNRYKAYNAELGKIIRIVRKEICRLKEIVKCLDAEVVGQLLINLRYLVKHVAFKEEQECRIIKIHPLHDDNDDKIINDCKHLYIEYLSNVANHIDKIYFGPKAVGFELFQSMLKNMPKDEEFNEIDCKWSSSPLA